MACRKGELSNEEHKAVTDALLFTTMCIIGLPVEVYARDGSVYSGIFHTATLDNDYAIVLKEARMTKKGNGDTSVVDGSLIETLIVQSEDLVQVVAKGVMLNGALRCVAEDGTQTIAGHKKCLDRVAKMIKTNKSKGNKKQKSNARFLAKRKNDISRSSTVKTSHVSESSLEEHNDRLDTKNFVKNEEAYRVPVDRSDRQVRHGVQEIPSHSPTKPELQDAKTTNEVRGSTLNLARSEAESTASVNIPVGTSVQQTSTVLSSGSSVLKGQDQVRPTSEETACTETSQSNISATSTPVGDVNSKSRLYTSSNPFLPIPPKNSNRNAKESKLNPGAKTFSPSMLHHKSGTPAMVSNGASATYMPDPYTMAPIAAVQQDFDANGFPNPSVPVKYVPYNNVVFGNGGSDVPYVQPVVGHVVSRTQPLRYDGQYHNLQTGPTYMNTNPQNVMFRRVGPLVCMHPFANDVAQSAAGFSSAAGRPLLTPYQMHLPKYQGNVSAQTLQLCTHPPVMTSAPQPFVMPNSIPISQSLFPVFRPVAVPGSNGFLSTKFA